jgi:hypothetical protein
MITIRHIERTCLDCDAFEKLIESYSGLEHDILVVFDKRISCLGMHTYDYEKKLHTIRISPVQNKFNPDSDGDPIKLDVEAEKHNLISTMLHELTHAHQREALKQSFFKYDYRRSQTIRNPEMAEFYSPVELEARTYETENILEAVEKYDSYCK